MLHPTRELERALPAGAAALAVRGLSLGLLAAVATGLYFLVRDADGRLPAWAAAVFLGYGVLCLPAYRRLTAHLQRERAKMAARDAGLVDAEALLTLAGDLQAFDSLPRMARRLISALRDAVGAETAALLVADPESGRLQNLGSKPAERASAAELPVLLGRDDPAIAELARSGRPAPVEALRDISADLDRHVDALGAELLVPLMHKDHLVGLVVLGPPGGADTYSDPQREVLGLVAHHVGTVVENARLFASATYDSLTGLLRREVIVERLDKEVERADRYHRPLAICMIDIDHFKKVNDAYGHLGGDVVLCQVATELQSGLRASDLAGRYGGEELLVVFPETAHQQAAAAAENVRARIEALRVPVAPDAQVSVQISVGVASLDGVDGDRSDWTESLIAAADRALYLAKETGRNRVEAGLVPEAVVAQRRREVAARLLAEDKGRR